MTDAERGMSEDDLITVCDACEQASCWHGIFFCEDYKVAGVKQMTRAALTAKGAEHPSYWKTDQDENGVNSEASHD